MDLFFPKNLRSHKVALPIVIWVHGGGWRTGNKSSGSNPDRLPALVSTGRYAGASISYRLSDEVKWPGQIRDCKQAIKWIRKNAGKYGVDPKKIAVWGSSAGGHLASILGTADDFEFQKHLREKPDNFCGKIQAVINYYGPSAFLLMDNQKSRIKHNSANSPESQLLGRPIQSVPQLASHASPLNHVSPDDAPHLIFHGMQDDLVPFQQSLLLHRKLKKVGVNSALISVRNAGHAMPASFTNRYVLPFLDHQFYRKGKFPADENL